MRVRFLIVMIPIVLAVTYLASLAGFVLDPMAPWPKLGLAVSLNAFTIGGTLLGCAMLACLTLAPCVVGPSLWRIIRSGA